MTDGFVLKSWVIDFANKVLKKASSNIYSTDEKKIGTWINGKPIYRIVTDDSSSVESSFTVDVSKSFQLDTDLMADMWSYTNSTSTPIKVNETTLQVYSPADNNEGVVAIYNNDTLVAKKENLPTNTTASFTIPTFELSSGATMTIKMGYKNKHGVLTQTVKGNIVITQIGIDEILKTEKIANKFVVEYTKVADKATT